MLKSTLKLHLEFVAQILLVLRKNKQMRITLVFLTLLISCSISGQIQDELKQTTTSALQKIIAPSTETDSGNIVIFEDNSIGVLLEKYNTAKSDLGFRVQIHSGLSRAETLKAQTNFMKIYPEINTYMIYQQPNFKIRVGDFENRLEVNRFFEEMKEAFPGAFIIQDEISPISN